MQDIIGKPDIETVVHSFYEKVLQDDKLGPVFSRSAVPHPAHYLTAMCDFWNMVLFSMPGYGGNPTAKHVEIDETIPLQQEHFTRWLHLWNETVDSLYKGETAGLAKKRATLMAGLISSKIITERDNNL